MKAFESFVIIRCFTGHNERQAPSNNADGANKGEATREMLWGSNGVLSSILQEVLNWQGEDETGNVCAGTLKGIDMAG